MSVWQAFGARSPQGRRLEDLDLESESSRLGALSLPLLIAATAIGYLALARIAWLWTHDAVAPPVFWPAAGFAIGIALLVDRHKRAAVLGALLVAAFANNMIFVGLTAWQHGVILFAVAIEFTTCVVLVQNVFDDRWQLGFDVRSAAVMAAMIGSGTVGATVVVVGLTPADPWFVWRTWALGVGLGHASIGGVMMTYQRPNTRATLAQLIVRPYELAATSIVLAILSLLAFSTSGSQGYLVVAVAIWLSARFGTWAAGPAVVIIIFLANVQTARGFGPFADMKYEEFSVQLFGIVMLFATLLVGRHTWNVTVSARRERALLGLLPDAVTMHQIDGTVIERLAIDPDQDPTDIESLVTRWPDLLTDGAPLRIIYDIDKGDIRHVEARLLRVDDGTVMSLCRDVTEQLNLLRELERANENWMRLASTAYEGFVEYGADSRLLYASDRWAEMYGLPVDQLIGRSAADLFPPTDPGFEDMGAWAANGVDDKLRTFESRHVRSDGTVIWTLVSQHARYQGGEFAGLVEFAADTTELHRAITDREVAELRLETLEQRERDRVARFLHDGPLQTLVALSYQLNATKSENAVSAMAPQLEQLEQMALGAIAEMRDGLDQLASAQLRDSRVGLALAAATARFRPQETPTLHVEDDIDEPLDVDVASTLYLIGREALVNAILHAGSEEIRVSISADATGYRLTVTDNGIGFDHAAAASPGHLGMRSMRQRAQQMGGNCEAASVQPRGTRISVFIPRFHVADRIVAINAESVELP